MISVVSDRKHVRMACYELLGKGPDEEDVRVLHGMVDEHVTHSREGDVFIGNIPIEYVATLQEKGIEVLVFECDIEGGQRQTADELLDILDRTARLVHYRITRTAEELVLAENEQVLVHCSGGPQRTMLWDYLRDHDVPHRPGVYSDMGKVSRALTGRTVVTCGILPRHAAKYRIAPGCRLFVVETKDAVPTGIVRYDVEALGVAHGPLGRRVTHKAKPAA